MALVSQQTSSYRVKLLARYGGTRQGLIRNRFAHKGTKEEQYHTGQILDCAVGSMLAGQIPDCAVGSILAAQMSKGRWLLVASARSAKAYFMHSRKFPCHLDVFAQSSPMQLCDEVRHQGGKAQLQDKTYIPRWSDLVT
jgi:hypothetical protein